MKRCFREKKFGADALARIAAANKIIAKYESQGLRLTLRQLYYQFVVANLIKNEEKAYKNLGGLISDARLAGLIDWNAIEDRVRQPVVWQSFNDPGAAVEYAIERYCLDPWREQSNYVELWVEKDALAGVLRPIASEYHVTMMVNRGYSSQSAMFESAQRFRQHNQKDCTLIYLGDHDPSGEDMVRDIRDRLSMFRVDVAVEKLALTMAQVEEYDPPPNPAKMSDSRAQRYVEEHGRSSWEVDALPPETLRELITARLSLLVDAEERDRVTAQEETDRAALQKMAKKLHREE